jgi:hypothetical protein
LPDVGRVRIGNLSDGVVRVYVEDVELYKSIRNRSARTSRWLTYCVELRLNDTAEIGEAFFASVATVSVFVPPTHS